jgi:hypothetical protein
VNRQHASHATGPVGRPPQQDGQHDQDGC